MIPGLHKFRYLLATRSELLVRVCLVVVFVSVVGVGVTFANPPTTEVTDTTDRRTVTTTLDSRATVERNSSLYPRGRVLSNMPVYSTRITPNATVRAVTSPPGDEKMRVEQQIVLVYTVQTADGETFWRQTRSLERTNASTRGDEVVSTATIDIPATQRRIDEIESDIGDAGHVTVRLGVKSRYSTAEYEGSLEERSEILVRDDSYEIDRLSMRDEYGPTTSELRPVPAKILRVSLPLFGVLVVPHTTLLFAFLGLCGALGLGSTVAFAPRFDPDAEQSALHAARYAEWISRGTLPDRVENRAVYMDTLEDLVDVAIDCQNRIVYDPSRDLYAVLEANAAYVYADEPSDQR